MEDPPMPDEDGVSPPVRRLQDGGEYSECDFQVSAMSDSDRLRLIALGGPRTGKTSIIKRFLFQTYTDKYKPTVEDLYNREYDFGNITLRVDFLDTAGDLQFPAMRRLSISTAHAFLLVYAVDSLESFETVKSCFEEIRESRVDYQDVPIVIVGNKNDLLMTEVGTEDVEEWISGMGVKLRVQTLQCSAKEDKNIRDIFKSFLTLSKLPIHQEESALKRRSSAYVKSRVPKDSSAPHDESPSKILAATKSPQFLTEDSAAKAKPRSRSLIRRSSRKAKQNVRDASTGPNGDCGVV